MKGKSTFINSSCKICWKKAQKLALDQNENAHVRYVSLMRYCTHPQPKTKVICPMCKAVSVVPASSTNSESPIDNVKCRACFRDRMTFVNLVPFDVPGTTNETQGAK